MKRLLPVVAILLGLLPAAGNAQSVVTYHNGITRHGAYRVPGLTLAAAATMRPDPRFHGRIDGHVYAQPLYWRLRGAKGGRLLVATESNVVYALDATTGTIIWRTRLGSPVPLSELPCGNIDPDGVTGTPVIDPAANVAYLDALTLQKTGPRHRLYALSLANGSVLPNWPVDVQDALAKAGASFSSSTQGERGGLLLFGGSLYVSYGGNWGDCGSYHGMVIQIDPAGAKLIAHWSTRAKGGGIWAQGGIAGDGQSLFVTTGNTFGTEKWSGGEAIIRLKPGLANPTSIKDYFVPANWQQLDETDKDLGGTEALPLDIAVPGSQPAKRVIAFGKDGNAYLVNRDNLGGIGGQLSVKNVSSSAIITAPAVLATANAAMVAFTSRGGGNCSGSNVTMLKIAGSGTSPISVAWCAPLQGAGAPILTTTDGRANPIVWVVGAEGDNMLHGWNALTGQPVFSGSEQKLSGLHHFVTILAAQEHLYFAADDAVYAFGFEPAK